MRNTKQRNDLKEQLVAHCKERLIFHQPKQEIVYRSSILLIDVINAAWNFPPPDTASSMFTAKPEVATSEFIDI